MCSYFNCCNFIMEIDGFTFECSNIILLILLATILSFIWTVLPLLQSHY